MRGRRVEEGCRGGAAAGGRGRLGGVREVGEPRDGGRWGGDVGL